METNIQEQCARAPALIAMTSGFWTTVPGASRYWVSVDGHLLSFVKREPRVIKPIKTGEYLGAFILSDDGVPVRRYIHRLMLEAWERPAIEGEQCRHLDGNRFNNSLNNLAWGSPTENAADKIGHGSSSIGERNGGAKLNADKVLRMRQIRETTGASFKSIARQFGVTTMTAHRAITKQLWRHL